MTQSAVHHIADAAEAEGYGDYQYALSMASAAQLDLQSIKENPDLPPTTRYNRLNVYLNDYIGDLSDKVVQQQKLGNLRSQVQDRTPRSFTPTRPGRP